MVNTKTLLPDLKELVGELAEDLLARSTENAEIDAGLRQAFQQIEKGGRTAQAFEVWREDYLDQVAVAWVLACVFVRFMEDNHLIDECWLAGEKERRKLAEDTHELFFRKHPHDTDREYFQHVFREVGKIPAAKDLFAEGKTPLWAVAPSGDAAMKLLTFWREMDAETGELKRSFGVQPGDTRFLGDLYQDLSERARKKYALLQTPVFVEEFILDRTLNPAIDEFGLDKVRMIDPTCGSGHFLLGGFARLFDQWIKRESNEIVAAQKALDCVWGVDINPFAVAIARFRLVVTAVQACGIQRLKQAPGWTIHLAAGDSLLFGSKPGYKGERTALPFGQTLFDVDPIYAVEDRQAVNLILGQGYHVVVGNPPYIIVKDRNLSSTYRELYSTCHQKYSLGVPFTQRFWELALQPGEANGVCGYVGLITTNSFMKREFGKKLIEEFFPKIDLTHVIDTSGAYIPGHGTPTVILLGRARKPVGETVRAVLGIKGEPATPEDASQGKVWQSILRQIDMAGAQNEYTSTTDVPRATFNTHPWSIGGGGVAELMEAIEENSNQTLSELADSIGIASFTLEDDVYILPWEDAVRKGIGRDPLREMVVGDMLRDWFGARCEPAIFPYDDSFRPIKEDASLPLFRYLWSYRTNLANSKMFGGKTKVQSGLRWYEYGRLTHNKLQTPLTIAFAFVATHNHFVLDRGGKVFNRTAPIIKLHADATEENHLALLGLLNSSVGCFWMKQTFQNRGSTVDQRGARQRTDPFEDFYEFTGTGLQRFPLPEARPLVLASHLDDFARQRSHYLPESAFQTCLPDSENAASDRKRVEAIHALMVALQEELDWQCYTLYGLIPSADKEPLFIEDFQVLTKDFDGLRLGQRAFEIVMARQMEKGELQTTWFQRHGSTPITEIPKHWPAGYRKLVERRIRLIETNKEIGLIERPEYKRRWNTEPWEQQEQRALRNWLLDKLEEFSHASTPELTTVARLADKASGCAEFMQVAALYRRRPDFDLAVLVAELVEGEAVPFLPLFRYKPSGLRKRALWERTWELQREEDRRGERMDELRQQLQGHLKEHGGSPPADVERMLSLLRRDIQQQEHEWSEFGRKIPVPPKYATADFQRTDYWRLRGKLDVPKERWMSYPHCSTDSDPSLLVCWAGWDCLQQAAALVHYYDARKREGWNAKRLVPLLAGLDQLLPWIHQWHPEIDKEFGETAGQSFQTMLEQDAHELGLTLDDIRNWQPPAKSGRGRTRAGARRNQKTEDDE